MKLNGNAPKFSKRDLLRKAQYLGLVLGLALLCAFFAHKASHYARLYAELRLERQTIDRNILALEKNMTHIAELRDKVNAMTTATVDRNMVDSSPLEKKTSLVRKALRESVRFTSEKERELNTSNRIKEIAANAVQVEQTMRGVVAILDLRKDFLSGIPSITPAAGWVSSTYGQRTSPFTGDNVIHKGIDIGSEEGVPIYASADGVVEYTGYSKSFGKLVIISHPFDIMTKFAHTSKILVKKGQKVHRGDLIAEVGTTGRSTGPHLHYEVWVGNKSVDPGDYLLDRNIESESAYLPEFALASIGGEELVDESMNGRQGTSATSLILSQPMDDSSSIVAGKMTDVRKAIAFGALLVSVLGIIGIAITSLTLGSKNAAVLRSERSH